MERFQNIKFVLGFFSAWESKTDRTLVLKDRITVMINLRAPVYLPTGKTRSVYSNGI